MLHIIQNDLQVPPGNIIDQLTVPCTVHHPYRGDELPEIEQISALIVMAGAMGANDDHNHPFLAAAALTTENYLEEPAKRGPPFR